VNHFVGVWGRPSFWVGEEGGRQLELYDVAPSIFIIADLCRGIGLVAADR
jgi:hypothetical protein